MLEKNLNILEEKSFLLFFHKISYKICLICIFDDFYDKFSIFRRNLKEY